MNDPTPHLDPDVKAASIKVCATWLCVIAGWKLSDWATLMALLASGMAFVFTVLQTYVLWRDKLRNRHEDRQGPPDSPAAP